MRGWAVAAVWILTMVVIGTCVNLKVHADAKQERWQDCGGIYLRWGDLACEYEFYKEYINE